MPPEDIWARFLSLLAVTSSSVSPSAKYMKRIWPQSITRVAYDTPEGPSLIVVTRMTRSVTCSNSKSVYLAFTAGNGPTCPEDYVTERERRKSVPRHAHDDTPLTQ